MLKTNKIATKPFWMVKKLHEMTSVEWESLCDGCGKCCLEKLEDEDTGEIYTTCVSCRLLDTTSCRCNKYEERFKYMDDCIKVTPKVVNSVSWLPKTCAYVLVKEGKDLFDWHPLKTNNPKSTIESGNAANLFAIHPTQMDRPLVEYIIEEE